MKFSSWDQTFGNNTITAKNEPVSGIYAGMSLWFRLVILSGVQNNTRIKINLTLTYVCNKFVNSGIFI